MAKGDFFTEFLRQAKSVGAIMPSSKYLVKKMIAPIDFTLLKCIVEFGPGTGIITHELLNRMPVDSKLFVFEINKEFCEKLQGEIKDPRLIIVSDTAENLEDYLAQHNIEQVDCIVSSLPFAMIPNGIVKNILTISKKVLKPNGVFIQYQYSLNVYRRLKSIFNNVDLDFTPRNLPPAFIFICKN